MKKTGNSLKLILIICLLIGIKVYGQADKQVYKLKSSLMSSKEKINGVWEEFGDWKGQNSLIVMDLDNEVINFWSGGNKSMYDIVDYIESVTDEDGDRIAGWWTVDSNGKTVKVLSAFLVESDMIRIYFYYNNIAYVYHIDDVR